MLDPRADLPVADSPPAPPVRVLVADDDAASLGLLALTLEASGFAVQRAVDGREAVERLTADPPDIVLLDFQMPGLNGVEVCASVRHHVQAALREIPIIMLTAHDGDAGEVACLHAGANDFISKPIGRASLVARIETQLRLRSLNAALRAQNDELAKWRAAHLADLEAAQRVQRAILPDGGSLPGWSVATFYAPMIQVGGDIYGSETRRNGTMLWLADATGHGVAAALCTMLVTILFQRAARATGDPAEVLARVNAGLFAIFRGASMLSALCVRVAPDGAIHFSGAGHPPLLVRRTQGKVESFASRSTLLGLSERYEGAVDRVHLEPGDRALLFTDGLYSARARGGRRRHLAEVTAGFAATPDLDALVARMRGASAFDDDATALLLRCAPGEGPKR